MPSVHLPCFSNRTPLGKQEKGPTLLYIIMMADNVLFNIMVTGHHWEGKKNDPPYCILLYSNGRQMSYLIFLLENGLCPPAMLR